MIRRLIIGCANISATRKIGVNILQPSINEFPIYPFANVKYYSDIKKDKTTKPAVENDRKLKVIKTEVIHLLEQGNNVPEVDDITAGEWDDLLRMSNSKRIDYYSILFRRHVSEKNEMVKRAIRKEMVEERRREFNEKTAENKHIQYGLGKNTLLMKVNPRTMDRWRNHKMFRSLLHDDSNLIYDCGFESEMTPFEIKNTAKQLIFSFGANRTHRHSFFFHFANLQETGMMYHSLQKGLPTIGKPTIPIRVTSNGFPENIAKERLVYLTPDSNNDLSKFNHNDVYIIGALVEKGVQKPMTMAKAKALDIRTARLPLDRYLQWKQSHKSLTLDQITRIMLDFKATGDMQQALKHVPVRKIRTT